MNYLNETIIRLGQALEKLKIREGHVSDLGERSRIDRQEAGLNAAIIADITEALFGSSAHGSPSLMSYPHAGCVCGP